MSPERIQGSITNDVEGFKKADMWSIGVLLYIIVAGYPPFEGKTTEELYTKISSGEFTFSGREWDNATDAKHLIYHLLAFDPQERFDAHDAMNHEFFKSTLF